MAAESYERIWRVISQIPYGKVANYGQIARIAGLGRRARMVGYALHSTPDYIDLPWHRVINAEGRISFPDGSASYKRQRRLLEAEGVVFIGGRVDLNVYRWDPGADDWPEEYLHPESAEYEGPSTAD